MNSSLPNTGSVMPTIQRTWRYLVLVCAAFALAACGGGGGGGGGGGNNANPNPPPAAPTGTVTVTVADEFAAPVKAAQISVASGSTTRTGTTDDDGAASIGNVPVGNADVSVSATGFEDTTTNVNVTESQASSVDLTMTRLTEPAAGLFAAQLIQALAQTDGQTVTFELEVLVVADDTTTAAAIETLTAADFTLDACADTDPNTVECLRGGAGQADIGYTVVSPTPDNFALNPGQAATPYAAALLIDQSESIEDNDPSDARLFATKLFMDNLGANDYVSVAAFALTRAASAPSLLPDTPVTQISGFIQSDAAEDRFSDIDELGELEGGDTPLFAALDQQLDFTAANAPTDSGRRLAVVLFTDGVDSVCIASSNPPCGVNESIAKSVAQNVDIFTIGLGTDIDVDTMRQLAQGGRGFFLFAENAQQLLPIYRSLGELLSQTLATYRMEWTIRADAPATYQTGQTILGNLGIDTGDEVLNLPLRLFLTN